MSDRRKTVCCTQLKINRRRGTYLKGVDDVSPGWPTRRTLSPYTRIYLYTTARIKVFYTLNKLYHTRNILLLLLL